MLCKKTSDLHSKGNVFFILSFIRATSISGISGFHLARNTHVYQISALYVLADYARVRFFELRPCIFRSPSDIDTLGRASVLRDGAAFRPASAPHPHLLENHFYQPFAHPSDPLHPHTAPHTPTEMEQQLERARSEERSNCDIKEGVAEGEKERERDRDLVFERSM